MVLKILDGFIGCMESNKREKNPVMFEFSVEIFKKINPFKKFSSFTYTEIPKNEIHLYLEKGEVVKIDNEFYIYAGEKKMSSPEKTKSYVLIKDGKKEIYKQEL